LKSGGFGEILVAFFARTNYNEDCNGFAEESGNAGGGFRCGISVGQSA
jgi:hypothetical protein